MMNQELANITALQIVAYIVSEEKYLTWLMNETGICADDFMKAPDNPDVLSGVLDFLLSHEDILIDCCEAQAIDPALPIKIRPFFPGASLEY